MPHRFPWNAYVKELGRGYQNNGCIVVYGPENLFESAIAPEIIHIHWPEALYRGYGEGPLQERLSVVLQRLDQHKTQGAKIVWTVHNLIAHELTELNIDRDAYQALIDRADLILHHCELSRARLAEIYKLRPETRELVLPHGNYSTYANNVTAEEARRRLGLSSKTRVYLHFGNIRGYKGLNLVLSAFMKAKVPNKFLIVAGRRLFEPGTQARLFGIRLRLYRYLSRKVRFYLRDIADDEVQIFFRAADALVLGHTRGLNSGVAVLGMTMGTLVIGPDLGCISEVLSQGRNISYATGDRKALSEAFESVTDDAIHAAREANIRAAANWDWTQIARRILARVSSA